MSKLFATVTLGSLLALAACTDDQTNLRKAGYDTIQAYNAVAPLARSYMAQPSAMAAQKAAIKAASANAIKVITPLGSDLESSNPVTAVEISAAEAAVAALQSNIAKGATP